MRSTPFAVTRAGDVYSPLRIDNRGYQNSSDFQIMTEKDCCNRVEIADIDLRIVI